MNKWMLYPCPMKLWKIIFERFDLVRVFFFISSKLIVSLKRNCVPIIETFSE